MTVTEQVKTNVVELFGPVGFEIENLTVHNNPQAPTVDPVYQYKTDELRLALTAITQGRHVWLAGPAGVGKTTFVEQLAAKLGRPFVRINFTRTTEPQDIVGGKGLSNGQTQWEDGALTAAIRVPNTIVLLDEPTIAKAGTLAILHSILDHGKRLVITETGEVVKVADGVVFFAADNTAGQGDDSGQYVETNHMNRAFLDRFAYTIEMDYLGFDKEVEILVGRTGIAKEIAEVMVTFAAVTRQEARKDEISNAVGMRRLVAWAEAVKAKVPPADAFRAAVLNQYDNSNREVIRQLEQSHVKYETINRYMTAVSDEDRKIIGEIARGERFNDAAVDKETGDIL